MFVTSVCVWFILFKERLNHVCCMFVQQHILFASSTKDCLYRAVGTVSFFCVPSVLQCVAVCCSVLQCVAVCCSVLQCVVCCSVLQCAAVCCSVLQYVAVCANMCLYCVCVRACFRVCVCGGGDAVFFALNRQQMPDADRHTDRQIDRQTDRQTNRQTDRQTY